MNAWDNPKLQLYILETLLCILFLLLMAQFVNPGSIQSHICNNFST